MEEKELIKLFKSGDFTIIYWDNQSASIYKGHWDINDDEEKMAKAEIDISQFDMNGYLPDIVDWLTRALGGHSNSI